MKARILLVEDEPLQRTVYADLFRKMGLETLTAGRASEALLVAEKSPPFLIVSDYVMPDMNGLEFCSAIRRNPRTRDVIFLIFTRVSPSDEEKSRFHDQPDGWIDKNAGPEAVGAAVTEWLKMMGR